LPSDADTVGQGSKNAVYAAKLLPYCLVVDAKGIVAGHGSLRENDGEIIRLFQQLCQQSEDVSRAHK
jgi:hypothetical protein